MRQVINDFFPPQQAAVEDRYYLVSRPLAAPIETTTNIVDEHLPKYFRAGHVACMHPHHVHHGVALGSWSLAALLPFCCSSI